MSINKLDKLKLKKDLILKCKNIIRDNIDFINKFMDGAQQEANQHKGAMQSRYDTFKEEAQALRDGYARQIDSLLKELSLITEITPDITEYIQIGSVIETVENLDGASIRRNYFVSTGILNKPITINDKKFICIKLTSPFGEALQKKKIGDIFEFRRKIVEIKNAY